MSSIFLDTYAIFELIKGNPNYADYKQGFQYITTIFNLTEFYYNLRRIGTKKEEAKECFLKFSDFRISVTAEVITDAGEFKLQHKKKKLSYADCIGYVTAKQLHVPFLTGDSAFEKFENVLFIK